MFIVKPSGIHGRGLFADRLIPADTVIGQLEGSYTTQDGAYVLWLDDEQGFRVENDLRYINHHREPNAAYFDDLTVAALRDIQPGEEITHNYLGEEAGDLQDDEHDWPECELETQAIPAALPASMAPPPAATLAPAE